VQGWVAEELILCCIEYEASALVKAHPSQQRIRGQFKITQLIKQVEKGHQEQIFNSRQRLLVGYASENGTIFYVPHSTFCIHPWNLQARHAGFAVQCKM